LRRSAETAIGIFKSGKIYSEASVLKREGNHGIYEFPAIEIHADQNDETYRCFSIYVALSMIFPILFLPH
jgi:hypothetical protein